MVRYAVIGYGLAGATFHAPVISATPGAGTGCGSGARRMRPNGAPTYPDVSIVGDVTGLNDLQIDAGVVATPMTPTRTWPPNCWSPGSLPSWTKTVGGHSRRGPVPWSTWPRFAEWRSPAIRTDAGTVTSSPCARCRIPGRSAGSTGLSHASSDGDRPSRQAGRKCPGLVPECCGTSARTSSTSAHPARPSRISVGSARIIRPGAVVPTMPSCGSCTLEEPNRTYPSVMSQRLPDPASGCWAPGVPM